MTLEQLRIFVAVAERLHVTQAAHALNLAQSAVSHAIAALEARHRTKLFDRVGRRIELTEAGRVLLMDARAIVARAGAAKLALNEFGALRRGTLSLQESRLLASGPSRSVSAALSADPRPGRQYCSSRHRGRERHCRTGICRGDDRERTSDQDADCA
jgi:DNA-binding transcriptional LysR family regulator